MEAFFTPDGARIYFAAYNEGLDVRIWAVDRDREERRSPRQLGPPVADEPAFYPTTTTEGIIYYSNIVKRRIFKARISGDSVAEVQDTGLEAMHAFISPDESFVLLDRREGGRDDDADIFVAFRHEDGSWSRLVNLGPAVNTDFTETCPSLSADGRFLFFSRYDEPNEVSNIYWVRAAVVEAARGSLHAWR
jgi:Tol biopolymer transport system component